jgi:hypothetical protein
VASFALFALVTAGFGWLWVLLDRATGAAVGTGNATSAGGTAGQGLWILAPVVTALGLGLGLPAGQGRHRGGGLGLSPRFAGQGRWYALAVAFPISTAAVLLLAGALTGTLTLRWTPTAGAPGPIGAVSAVLPFLAVKNVLEELVFRGYGTPAAIRLGLPGPWPHLLVGAVWGLWHLPLYLVWMSQADYRSTTSLPLAVYLPMFCGGTLAMAVPFGELRLRTGSIWPGVLLHTVAGGLAVGLLTGGNLTLTCAGDALFSPNANSIGSTLLFAVAGVALLRRPTRAAL